MMTRYMIRGRLRDPTGLKDFNAHDYCFSTEQFGPGQLVFPRDAPWDWLPPIRRLSGPLLFRYADTS